MPPVFYPVSQPGAIAQRPGLTEQLMSHESSICCHTAAPLAYQPASVYSSRQSRRPSLFPYLHCREIRYVCRAGIEHLPADC